MQKIMKYIIGSILILLILASFGYNAVSFLKNREAKVFQNGVNFALQQLAVNVEQKGEFVFTYNDEKGVSKSLTLVKKLDAVKK